MTFPFFEADKFKDSRFRRNYVKSAQKMYIFGISAKFIY